MNLLVDTHVLLWWLTDAPALPDAARAAIAAPENRCIVSAASAWEIAIKRALGKIDAPDDLRRTLLLSGFEELTITLDHAWVAGSLPRLHDDPFDRMLVAQALVEELVVATADPRFAAYGVTVLGG